jgi:hypothetical protein
MEKYSMKSENYRNGGISLLILLCTALSLFTNKTRLLSWERFIWVFDIENELPHFFVRWMK